MKNRARIVSVLAALGLALLAPAALASVSRSSQGPDSLGIPPASLAQERPLASAETAHFALGLTQLADTAAQIQKLRLFTGGELRPQPLTAFEPSYPETRVWAFDFLGTPLVGVSSGVSHELQRGCGDSWLGTPEGIGNWLSEDPQGDIDSPNRYAYVGWRPNEATDPTGEIAETPWDAASLGLGLTSLAYNAVEGNWAAAGLDAFGVALDAVATATPFLPGGASVAIKASRGFKALRAIDQGINATQGFFQAGQAYQEGHYFQAGLYGAMSGLGFRGALGQMDELGLRIASGGTGMNLGNTRLVHNMERGGSQQLTVRHIVKPDKTTDVPSLMAEVQKHFDAWNDVIARSGMAGLKQRLRSFERHQDLIQRAGAKARRGLGSAGPGRAWPHYPDMAGGGFPRRSLATVSADRRLNSIIGAQMDLLRKRILSLPDETNRLDWVLELVGK